MAHAEARRTLRCTHPRDVVTTLTIDKPDLPDEPAWEIRETTSARELRSAALNSVAQRAEEHLHQVMEAVPWGLAVVRGDHVIVSNRKAIALLPGPDAGTFAPPAVALLAAQAPVVVPAAHGRPVRACTHPITWDGRECVLLTLEESWTPSGTPPPVAVPPQQRPRVAVAPREPERPVAPRSPGAEAWTRVVDVAGGRIAGFSTSPGPQADETEVRRCLVRAIGALAEWGRSRSALETPVTMVRLPPDTPVDAGLVAFVEAVLRRAPAHAGRLWLRLEPAATSVAAPGALASLRRLGPRVMLEATADDDAVVALADTPADGLTVSPSAIAADDWSAIQAGLSIARHHGLATLATGVGDAPTHERLRAIGCRWAEGPAYGDSLTRQEAASQHAVAASPRA